MKIENCLVTGASGLLGKALCEVMTQEYNVHEVTFTHSTQQGITCDLRRNTACMNLLQSTQPDVLIHAAAYRDPDFCERYPVEAQRLNVDAVSFLVQHMSHKTKLVYISTDYVFSGNEPPYTEKHKKNPLNEYGRTKSAAEETVLKIPETLILRMPVLVEPQSGFEYTGFMAQLAAIVMDKTHTVLDDVALRYPTSVYDIASATLHLLKTKQNGIFHCSSDFGGTFYSLAKSVGQHLKQSTDHLEPSKKTIEKVAPRPLNSHLDTRKIKSAGFDNFHSILDMINLQG